MNQSKRRRVLILVENNQYPHDPRVRYIAQALVADGYQVTVIAPTACDQPLREEMAGVCVIRYRARLDASGALGYVIEYGHSLMVMTYLSLMVYIRRGFDVIHACNPPDTLVLIGLLFRLLGVRYVFDHHDLAPEMYHARFGGSGNWMLTKILMIFEKLSCRMADHVISTNESYKRVVVERTGIDPDRVTVVRNGPDLTRVRLTAPDRQLRGRHQVILGFVGVMGYQDGIDYLLKALHYLTYTLTRRDYYCFLVGSGDAWVQMQELAKELQLDQHVWFVGRASDDELMRYLSASDICVDPDPYNPFNDHSTMIKMAEYMALGKPIVAFDLTEHRVTAGDAALYADRNDVEDFARKIVQLMDDPQLRDRMGRLGRERVESSLAWPHQIQHLLAVYGAICNASSKCSASLATIEGKQRTLMEDRNVA